MTPETQVTGGREEDLEHTIDALNEFLRGELSAIQTYAQLLERRRGDRFEHDLEECKRSHEERAEMLRQVVLRVGGEPSETAAPWGGLAHAGGEDALAALEAGEEDVVALYRGGLARLDAATRELVERSLLAEQERTLAVVRASAAL